MLGWILVFALTFLSFAISTLGFDPAAAPISSRLGMILSGVLFLITVLARVSRNRA